MSDRYKIRDKDQSYYITMTTVGWIDVFTRPNQKKMITNSLQHCVQNKGLLIFAYCLMSNHLHMICRAEGAQSLSGILRDFKSYTSKQITKLIEEEPESRREWILSYFTNACENFREDQKYKVWQTGNQAKEIFSSKFMYEKLEYIHNNPVKELIVAEPEEYLFSSARDYAGMKGYVDVFTLDPKPMMY